MQVNSGKDMSLNFMGRKLRNHTVSPATKHGAWENTDLSRYQEDSAASSRLVLSHPIVSEELPGSVSDLREDVQHSRPCKVHNTLLEHDKAGEEGLRHLEGEAPVDVRMFIPFDSAKFCITQITNDMMAMKSKHQEMIQELEENFLVASQENQKKTALKIRTHYQNKLSSLKRILDIYQEKVSRKNAYFEEKVQTLENLNERLKEQHQVLLEKNQEDLSAWDREKSKMMEVFSSRLDLLQSHQALTLQELHLARTEMGKVQEKLEAPQEKARLRNTGKETGCSTSVLPLDGGQTQPDHLEDDLLKKADPVEQSAYALLLRAVILQAHQVYSELFEAKQQFEKLTEDNRKILAEMKESLEHESNWRQEPDKSEQMSNPQLYSGSPDRIIHHKITQVALECIRSGVTPTVIETEASETCMAQLDEAVKKMEENFRQNGFLISETEKSVGQQLLMLQSELKQMREENRKIIENYTTERTLRKKYYNMVEDMKGKIRVFCRIRPLTRTEQTKNSQPIVSCLDDYSVLLHTPRGTREFQFDKIFNSDCTQEEVFQESSGLIQCAIDGFNVCIFAYGHTGSGKTFTMVGERDGKNPGIIPRTFSKLFEIIQENESKFEFKVSVYMLELYNERLQDLFVSPCEALGKRIEMKRDRKGLVFAQGAETKEAAGAGELFALFEQGCANRHIAATKMNVESSRSHLIIGIMIESQNLTNGSVSFGKLSLVDLAGSERAAKTGAKDDQLKEANSINKSLSALGDVISALSMEQPHVPYRNNKLTQLMQDSLGGNAKTLMFLNVSPSHFSLDETLTSLIYATRVKAITNNAQRNVDSKEVAQLKEVILKLKSGQSVEEDV